MLFMAAWKLDGGDCLKPNAGRSSGKILFCMTTNEVRDGGIRVSSSTMVGDQTMILSSFTVRSFLTLCIWLRHNAFNARTFKILIMTMVALKKNSSILLLLWPCFFI